MSNVCPEVGSPGWMIHPALLSLLCGFVLNVFYIRVSKLFLKGPEKGCGPKVFVIAAPPCRLRTKADTDYVKWAKLCSNKRWFTKTDSSWNSAFGPQFAHLLFYTHTSGRRRRAYGLLARAVMDCPSLQKQVNDGAFLVCTAFRAGLPKCFHALSHRKDDIVQHIGVSGWCYLLQNNVPQDPPAAEGLAGATCLAQR